jgi:hypothetical protein
MSAYLIVIVPVASIAIVMSLCFMGCNFQPGADIASFTDYHGTVTATAGLIACWPLSDTSGTTATDISPNHFNGAYTVGPNVPAYNAAQQSDAAPGTFALDQTGIVAGDTLNNNPSTPSPCTAFNGGYVQVPWQAALNPAPPFTLEAWVIADWTLQDAQNNPSYRVVVASNGLSAFQGFALFASPQNLWAAAIGVGSQNIVATTGNNQIIVQSSLYYLVVTYDGNTLSLWVNPADPAHQPPDGQASATGFTPLASPTPMYIGMGRPDQPTPLFPFNGRIEDVAFYNVVLDAKTIGTHYLNGLGLQKI